MKTAVALTLVVLGLASAAPAGVTVFAGGIGAPPATLGGYTMTPFPLDGRPLDPLNLVTSVPSPLGGDLGFSIPMDHDRIGVDWATWSHGYTGDVYDTDGATSVTLTLPAGTGAFYFYAEPDFFGEYTIVATSQDGNSLSQDVLGNAGATMYGFYGEGGSLVSTVTVTSSTAFAVGEFGIAAGVPVVPAPGALLLGALGAGLVSWMRRRGTL